METTPTVRNTAEATSSFVGYSSGFEIRPEPLFTDIVRMVVDASMVRKFTVGQLKVFHIPDVHQSSDEVFLGFGMPNTYLVVNDGKDHSADARGKRPKFMYQKFAGKSLKRAPSKIEETRNLVQAGIHVRFLGLPAHAHEAIRVAMRKHDGTKYWTCVNACLRVLEDAGFQFGPGARRKLSSVYLPYQLFSKLLRHGLYFEGQRIEFEFVRTSDLSVEEFMKDVIKAELTTFCRHADRAIDGKAETGKNFWKAVRWARYAPGRLVARVRKPKPPVSKPKPLIAPLLPDGVEYANDIRVRVSKPSQLGLLLRLIWKPHVLFELSQDRVRIEDHATELLQPFPQKNPSLATRLKKWILFNKVVINYMLRHLAPTWEDLGTFDERTVHRMLRTHSAEQPNKYNCVIRRNGAIVITRISVGSKIADWVLSKHVLLGEWEAVPWAGEPAKLPDGALEMDPNSGTYQPKNPHTIAACNYLQAIFPHWNVTAKLREPESSEAASA